MSDNPQSESKLLLNGEFYVDSPRPRSPPPKPDGRGDSS